MSVRPWTAPVTPAAAALAARMRGLIPEIAIAGAILRAPDLADFAVWRAVFTGERSRFMGGPYSEEAAWDQFNLYVGGWMLRGHGAWAIRTPEGTQGFVLIGFEPGDAEHELGFFLTEAAEGRGLARAAALAARDHAFEVMGLQTLVSYTDPANARVARLCAALGARPEPALFDGVRIWRHQRRAT